MKGINKKRTKPEPAEKRRVSVKKCAACENNAKVQCTKTEGKKTVSQNLKTDNKLEYEILKEENKLHEQELGRCQDEIDTLVKEVKGIGFNL